MAWLDRKTPGRRELLDRIAGHAWTLGPRIGSRLFRPAPLAAEAWSTEVQDPTIGPVRIGGLLRSCPGSETLVMIIHGMGGLPSSGYCVSMARAADALGYSSLRLAMRGADRQGEDFYHAGLTEDLHAALRCEQLAGYRRILLAGYSLGGLICIRASLEALDPRVRAAVAICPPLDLSMGQKIIDSPGYWLYRRYVLGNLFKIYRAVARRRPVPTPVEEVVRVRTIRRWDQLTVVPRFGFASVDDYYEQAGILDRIHGLRLPVMVVASTSDPIVPVPLVQGAVSRAPGCLEMRWVAGGGHTYFPADLDLGFSAGAGLDNQVLRWLQKQ